MAERPSPTLVTIATFVAVFFLQTIAGFVGLFQTLFVLSAPVTVAPWTVLSHVFAHAGSAHLLGNAVGLLLPGIVLERRTSAARYYAYFLGTGAVAGLTEVVVGGLLGPAPGVVGASGAVFAFWGYLLSSNRLADTAIGGIALSSRVQAAIFAVVAVAITLATASPRVALLAHFSGLFVGLVAGRAHLLRD